ncbi:MAG: transcriptional regulator [Anaerolineaceae bacterium 4572_32.1]|nr:MAG: transcriptional regulator [Anaerolineaceae bacterium 4572_32.1]
MGLPTHWRLKNQRYQLTGEICHKCGAKLFPPRDVCPECNKPAYEPFTFSGKGEIYSYSTMYQVPDGYREYAPYTVALVKLEEGPLVTAQLADVDTENVEIGMPVEMVTRKMREYGEDGVIVYGYKFRPAGLA